MPQDHLAEGGQPRGDEHAVDNVDEAVARDDVRHEDHSLVASEHGKTLALHGDEPFVSHARDVHH